MSSAPTPYTRKANFVSYEGASPNNPKRGTDLDAEFDAIKVTSDATRSRLAEIQRTDGKLANDAVHIDAIPAATRTVLVADSAAQATAAAASASASAGSASASATSATAANTAKTAAQTAKTAAETARDAAAASAADAVQATSYTGPGVGAVNRTLHSKLADVAHVKDFGAVGDGVADDSAALNAAFAWLRTYAVTDPPASRPVRLTGHGGTYRVTQSINGTGIALGRTWELDGLTIVGECAGKTVLDLSGMRFGKLRNVRVYGSLTTQPHTGILLSYIAGPSPCSNNVFEGVSVDGYFTSSAFHMRSAEVNRFNGCDFWNRRAPDGGGESWAAILDGAGYKPTMSDYQTLTASLQSFTVNSFNGCTFQKPFAIAGPTVFMQDAASISFNSCYITNGSGSGIVWRLTAFVPYRVFMDFQQETTNTDRFIQFTSDAAAAREVRGLSCTFGNSFTDGEIFSYDTLTALKLNSFKCHLYRLASGVSLANGLFNPSAAVTINDGDIVVPAFADFDGEGAFASFKGKVSSMDGKFLIYGGNEVRILAQSAVAASHTGDIVETTLATVTVPANAMGPNGRIRVTTTWSVTNNANGKGLRVRFGGTLLNSQPATSALSGRYVTELANRNSMTSQVGNSTGLIGIGPSGVVVTTATIDTTVAQDITIQCLLANAGDTATLESYVVELLRGE